MKKFFLTLTAFISIFLLLTVLFIGCKKSVSPVNGTTGNQPPAITPVGTPVGNPITKNVGAGGGSVTSPDGRLQLDIPAGALAANTDISIQPVTNESPGGLGLAYQLLPEGIAFKNPVTITFHYTDGEINGSHPFFVYIASQDSTGGWHADRINRDLDTVAKTISIASTHFSIWSILDDIKLKTQQDTFKINETNSIEVDEILPLATDVEDGLVASLNSTYLLPDNIVSNWSINGHGVNTAADGQISGSGSKVNYTAPATITKERTVQVSVKLKFHLVVYNKGKKIGDFNEFFLFANLTLLPDDHNYTLTMEIGDGSIDVTGYAWSYLYSDHASMDINISGDSVTISNILNYPTVFIPKADYCSVTYTPEDSAGPLNIVNVQGYADNSNEHIFNLHISSANSSPPNFTVKCPNEAPMPYIGNPVEHNYDTPDFKLDDSPEQTFNTYDPNNGPQYIKYTLTHK